MFAAAGWGWADVDITTYDALFSARCNSGIKGSPEEYDTEFGYLRPLLFTSAVLALSRFSSTFISTLGSSVLLRQALGRNVAPGG